MAHCLKYIVTILIKNMSNRFEVMFINNDKELALNVGVI